LSRYAREPQLHDGKLIWIEPPEKSLDANVLRGCDSPFSPEGGLRLLKGNLGQSVIKTSAVESRYWRIEAPARIFESQEALAGSLNRAEVSGDFIAVIRGQGPKANGMPELHQLLPALSSLLSRGRRVAIVTDGRMSGASGKVPAAIHLTPEALDAGPIARLRDGDMITLDAEAGRLDVHLDESTLMSRQAQLPDLSHNASGTGRELFARLRALAGAADTGGSILY
jgi:phosphogluconate dehydratase